MNTNYDLLNLDNKKYEKVKKGSRPNPIKLTANSYINFKNNVKEKLSLESKIQKEIDSYNNSFKEIKSMTNLPSKNIDNSELIDQIETEIASLESHGIKLIELNEKMKRVSFYKEALAKPIKLKDKFIYTLRNKKELFKLYKKSIQNKLDSVSEYSEYVGNVQNELFKSIKNKNDIKIEDNLNNLYDGKDKFINQEPYSLENNKEDIEKESVETKTSDPDIQNVSVVVPESTHSIEPGVTENNKTIPPYDPNRDIYSYSSSEINKENNLNKFLKGSTTKRFSVNSIKDAENLAGNNAEIVEKAMINTIFNETNKNEKDVNGEIVNEIPKTDLETLSKTNVEKSVDVVNEISKPDLETLSKTNAEKSDEVVNIATFEDTNNGEILDKKEKYVELSNVLNNVLSEVSSAAGSLNTSDQDSNKSGDKDLISDNIEGLVKLDENIELEGKELYKKIAEDEKNIPKSNEIPIDTLSLDELILLRSDLSKQLEMVNEEIKEKNNKQLEIENNKYVVENFHVSEDTIGHYKENNDFSEYFSNPEVMESVRTEKIRQNPSLVEDYKALKELLTEGYNPEEVSSLAINGKEEVDFSEEIDRLVNSGLKK